MDISGNEVGDTEMRLHWKDYNITGYVTSVTWSGSAKQAARTIEFNIAYSPNDKSVKVLDIKNGDKITFYPGYPDDKKTKFVGMVTSRERKSEAGELSYTAMDGMIHLLRSSGTYKFTNTTPEKIAQMVCKDVNVKVGSLAKTKVTIPKIFFQERPYYEIIMAGYTKAHRKNKKLYIAQMNGTKLDVVEKGKIIPKFHIVQGERILSSSYTETLDNMVNRVYIYDSNNKKIGSVSNSKWTKKYGIFQNAISVDSGTGKTEAKNELHGIDKTASLQSIGDIRCVAGMGLVIKDSRTGLNGKFWIENDSHEWSNGTHTMTLELAFKNIMDVQEEDEEQVTQVAGGSVNTAGGTSDALNAVLNQARSWIGISGSTNEATQYYGWSGVAWCCIFVWACFNKAGYGSLFMGGGKTAACSVVTNWYSARGKTGSVPKVGALVMYGPGGGGHIGIVESVSGTGKRDFTSIEGNISNRCGRFPGGGRSDVYCFCYPDWPVTQSGGEFGGTTYTLSESQLRGIARLCQQEQGTVIGAMAEASLMANRFEMENGKWGVGANGLYNYVQNSRWFAKASLYMSQGNSARGDIVEGVRKVLINGNRTLPKYVNEHDCFSDITSVSNNGVGFSVSDRSQYKQDITRIRNAMGGNYTFYCFPDTTSDPFGYEKR